MVERIEQLTITAAVVLFDSDGVLVDSDASVASAWKRWALAWGFDPELVFSMVHGRRAADTVALLVDPALRVLALEDINLFEVQDAAAVTAIPGSAELVGGMGGAWAVVTSATRALAGARLGAAGIVAPPVLVTADDVRAGKPSPEGYLAAAARLDVPIEHTVVVEDAPSGVQAARAAGVRAVVGVGRRALETDADVVITDLSLVRWTGVGLVIPRRALLRAHL
ncbi:sugar-phosphatase [Nakamurella sp. UYEF19]|uniref:HAD-IA family hydrolase n=1 Tax=Nakamurella sp. UYEF19 TaxID=1756392 RepID=UPI0033991C32